MLATRADRDSDHVGFNPFVVADAGIETCCQHVDKRIVRYHLQRDARMRCEKARDDRRQDVHRHDGRDIQPQGAGRAVAETVDGVERAGNFAQRRPKPLQQALAGFRDRDATRGPVQQPHAEPGFEPTDCLTQR